MFWSDWRKNGKCTNNKNHNCKQSPRATDSNKCSIPMPGLVSKYFFFHFSLFLWQRQKRLYEICDILIDSQFSNKDSLILQDMTHLAEDPQSDWGGRIIPGMFWHSRSVFSRIVGVDMLDQQLLQLWNSLFSPPGSYWNFGDLHIVLHFNGSYVAAS